MRRIGSVMARFFTSIGVTGCASTEVTERRSYVGFGKIARPDRIIVFDFSATLASVPDDSLLADCCAQHSAPQTREKNDAGRKLGAQVAQEMAAEIWAIGLSAVRAAGEPVRQLKSIENSPEQGGRKWQNL